jgi:hypothetical protein
VNRRVSIALAVLVAGTAAPALAIDAGKWRDLDEPSRRGYVTAVVDTWLNFNALIKGDSPSHAEKTFVEVVTCINERKLGPAEVYTATADYVERRTDRRTFNMAAVTWAAVSELCKK